MGNSSMAACFGCFVNNPCGWYPPLWGQWGHQQVLPTEPFPSTTVSLPVPSLTDVEKECLAHLAKAWSLFSQLTDKNPQDDSEFVTSIHDAQKMIALRVARRIDTDVWKQPNEIN